MKLTQKESRLAYLFLAPALVVIILLIFFPVIYNVSISFAHATLETLGGKMQFAGLKNYREVVSDPDFHRALFVTIVYSLAASILSIIIGLAAAMLLNIPFRGRGVCRAAMLIPYVAPIISLAFVWKWMLETHGGLVNALFLKTGLIEEPIAFLADSSWALPIVILFQGWRYFPFAMLLILARLQAIPKEMYEAAEVDGAGITAKFFHITLPGLKYILGVLFLLRFVWTFNKFDDIYLLTSGGAGTKVLPILTYQYAFSTNLNPGQGAAVSTILALILVVFILIYQWKVLSWQED